MKPLLRGVLSCALLLGAVPAAAEEASTPPPAEVKTDFIKPFVVVIPEGRSCGVVRKVRREVPSWALSRMHILVPDGTPKQVYRAPSADLCSPDF